MSEYLTAMKRRAAIAGNSNPSTLVAKSAKGIERFTLAKRLEYKARFASLAARREHGERVKAGCPRGRGTRRKWSEKEDELLRETCVFVEGLPYLPSNRTDTVVYRTGRSRSAVQDRVYQWRKAARNKKS